MPSEFLNQETVIDQSPDVDLSKSPSLEETASEKLVGLKIRGLRNQRKLSLRVLAEKSGLNINTLSLIENGKSSPSVGTLQHLARAMGVHISAFFESEPTSKRVVYTSHDSRPEATFSNAHMQNLGKDLAANAVQPFVVTLEPEAGSGGRMIVHTGYEFVYCLKGKVQYIVDEIDYSLLPGDSLLFESHLPHRWKNIDKARSQIILILFPVDQLEEPGGRHFINETHK